MCKTLLKHIVFASVMALCTPALMGSEEKEEFDDSCEYISDSYYNEIFDTFFEASTDSQVEDSTGTRGTKRPHSAITPEVPLYPASWNPTPEDIPIEAHPLFLNELFQTVSFYLDFKDYFAGFGSSCIDFRHWVIQNIVGFSEHYEFPNKYKWKETSWGPIIPLDESERWTMIPQDYKFVILQNKHYLTAFTSLIFLDFSLWNVMEQNLWDFVDKGDYHIDTKYSDNRIYFIRGDDLPSFTNLLKLNLVNNCSIQQGKWMNSLTSLTSLVMSDDIGEHNECGITGGLEKFSNLQELEIRCYYPLKKYDIFLELTNLRYFTIDMSYLSEDYDEERENLSPYSFEEQLWEKLPRLEVFEFISDFSLYHSRASFFNTKQAKKEFIANFKKNNPFWTYKSLDVAFENFRKEKCKKYPFKRSL